MPTYLVIISKEDFLSLVRFNNRDEALNTYLLVKAPFKAEIFRKIEITEET